MPRLGQFLRARGQRVRGFRETAPPTCNASFGATPVTLPVRRHSRVGRSAYGGQILPPMRLIVALMSERSFSASERQRVAVPLDVLRGEFPSSTCCRRRCPLGRHQRPPLESWPSEPRPSLSRSTPVAASQPPSWLIPAGAAWPGNRAYSPRSIFTLPAGTGRRSRLVSRPRRQPRARREFGPWGVIPRSSIRLRLLSRVRRELQLCIVHHAHVSRGDCGGCFVP